MPRYLALALSLAFLLSCKKPSDSQFPLTEIPPAPMICPKAAPTRAVFTDQSVAIPLSAKAADHDTGQWLKSRAVKVQFTELQKALREERANLEIFPGEILELATDSFYQSEYGTWVASGKINQDPLSSFTFSFQKETLSGHLLTGSGPRYVIRYLQPETHLISAFAENENNDGEICAAQEAPETVIPEPGFDLTPSPQALQTNPTIDLLVAYTPAALAKAGSREALQTLIELGISDTNQAYVNSGVSLSVRLVGVMALSQNESTDFSADLGALAGRTDGRWDAVHGERSQLGADQVTLLGAYPNNKVAGIAYIKASSRSAFSIVKISSFGNFTFTHELGHNIGLRHTDGFVNQSGAFRTIMAYGSVVRIRRFSNPLLTYLSYATGDTDRNSSGLLNSLGGLTASLLAATIPWPAPTPPSTESNTPVPDSSNPSESVTCP
jgi:hypothetical protein